jgi:hypothetical protein
MKHAHNEDHTEKLGNWAKNELWVLQSPLLLLFIFPNKGSSSPFRALASYSVP